MVAGKRIGNNLYIHKSATWDLNIKDLTLIGFKLAHLREIDIKFNFNIIRINSKEQKVAFIQSEDWDTATEPQVGDSYCINENNKVSFKKGCGQIYHHKWRFVQEHYTVFDIHESMRWSAKWLNSDIVKKLKADKQEHFNCKIGYKKYFDEVIKDVRREYNNE